MKVNEAERELHPEADDDDDDIVVVATAASTKWLSGTGQKVPVAA